LQSKNVSITGRPSTTQDDVRNFIEINFNQTEFSESKRKKKLDGTLFNTL
jgi:hypothetical protein